MNSVILQIASKYLKALLLVFALIALLRGHNYPGGGFIGGLLAAMSVIFSSLAFTTSKVEKRLWIQPEQYIGLGLGILLLSFLPGIWQSEPLMKGLWFTLSIPLIGDLKLGTPFLFDIGVFLTVIGVTILFFFTLSKRE